MAHTPEQKKLIADKVKETAVTLAEYMADRGIPTDIGMAALAMTLVTVAKNRGMTRHEVIDRFITSVNTVYKEGLHHGTDARSKGQG
jgi:hypothetical protein